MQQSSIQKETKKLKALRMKGRQGIIELLQRCRFMDYTELRSIDKRQHDA